MSEFFDTVNNALISATDAWWLLPATFLLIVLDGLFPVVPSEALVMALAALDGRPALPLLIAVAALGAITGDNLSFAVGRLLGPGRFDRLRVGRVARTLDAGRRQLERRPATVILTGRFVPVGRVAVYLAAGASGYPHRRFLPISILGGTVWAFYMLALGLVAAAWVDGNPLFSAAVGVGLSLVLGAVADILIRWRRARRTAA
ncbi:DedA family protein [Ornithinimicrobium sp. F0845]|uniref:DedA family protein n=1 Tax=Ornithinimicrobium sp. F0845 TaxID=2926412 RepID=UPI001FF114AE|nr:DedA family protein [Ornithinimicrobium sp. F0845]MCK0111715.1 DedA family protein [Ornithinimicrobium sp. F0845]